MQHADKLLERIIFLDGFPNMQVLDPLHIGQDVKEVLDCDLAAEISARRPLRGSRYLLLFRQGLRVTRSVREADA
jgi:bacterioferritin